MAYLAHDLVGIQQIAFRTIERHTRNTLLKNHLELVCQDLFLTLGLEHVGLVGQCRDDCDGQVMPGQEFSNAGVVEIAPAWRLLVVKLVIPTVVEISQLDFPFH